MLQRIKISPILSLFSANTLQTPVSLHVIHLLKNNASHSAQKKKNPPPDLASCHSLCPTIPSWAFRGGDSAGDRLVLTPTPTKRALMLRWEDWKVSPAATLVPGSWSLIWGQNCKHCRKKKRGKRRREKEQKGRDSQKERLKDRERELLGCYSLTRSPFLWWSHLLREGERRSAVQTLKHDPLHFHYYYWEFWFYSMPVKTLNVSRSPDSRNKYVTRKTEFPEQCNSAEQHCNLTFESDNVQEETTRK